MIEFSAVDAIENYRNPLADWSVARRRMRSGRVVPHSKPTFSLQKTDTILTLGSCFARNIESYLARFGCVVPSIDLSSLETEINGQALNRVIGLFTPPTFHQAIVWAEKIWKRDGIVRSADCDRFFLDTGDGTYIDLGLAQPAKNSYEQCLLRRQQLYKLYVNAFTAECVMVTPGLVETWFDQKEQLYTVTAPMRNGQLFGIDRFSFRVLDYPECVQPLLATIDLIREHNPTVKFLITVSPVPLRFTFSDRDILISNTFSKSVLRAACDTITRERVNVDYFPSYEAVTLSTWKVWQKDRRHVNEGMVAEIVVRAFRQYFEPDTPIEDLQHLQFTIGQRIANYIRGILPKSPAR